MWAVLVQNKVDKTELEYIAQTGLVAAAASLQHRAQPPVMNLRNLNPYVASALGEWAKPATNLAAAVPRGLIWKTVAVHELSSCIGPKQQCLLSSRPAKNTLWSAKTLRLPPPPEPTNFIW